VSLSVAAFTQGQDIPSARFRVRQLINPLAERGISVQEYPAKYGSYPPSDFLSRIAWLPKSLSERVHAIRRAEQHEVALFQREMVSTLATVERLWKKPVVIDIDDAIWVNQRFNGADRLAVWAKNVICGNSFIAEHFSGAARTWVLPTAVDTSRFVPAATRGGDEVLVWSGSGGGLSYLYEVLPAIRQVMKERSGVKLRVVSDVPPVLTGLADDRVEYLRWSPGIEVSALQSASIGLMPMSDTPWTRGKCSFKMLTYMACGLPVVVSPWGMNAEVLALGAFGYGARSTDEWRSALLHLLREKDEASQFGAAGRAVVEQHYSIEKIASRLEEIVRTVAAT